MSHKKCLQYGTEWFQEYSPLLTIMLVHTLTVYEYKRGFGIGKIQCKYKRCFVSYNVRRVLRS